MKGIHPGQNTVDPTSLSTPPSPCWHMDPLRIASFATVQQGLLGSLRHPACLSVCITLRAHRCCSSHIIVVHSCPQHLRGCGFVPFKQPLHHRSFSSSAAWVSAVWILILRSNTFFSCTWKSTFFMPTFERQQTPVQVEDAFRLCFFPHSLWCISIETVTLVAFLSSMLAHKCGMRRTRLFVFFFQHEQVVQLLVGKYALLSGITQHALRKHLLVDLPVVDFLFHGTSGDQPHDLHVAFLSDSPSPLGRLCIGGRVPIGIHQHHPIRAHQRQPQSTHARGQQEDVLALLCLERIDQGRAIPDGRASVHTKVFPSFPSHLPLHEVQHLLGLGENEHPVLVAQPAS
mmetsp:Transcript_10401/g.63472  ORF Transcript_10401/g.63472 Transcript_10401/m.63472 type:complete len:344 (+) Transcript_10401:108-1139(+)